MAEGTKVQEFDLQLAVASHILLLLQDCMDCCGGHGYCLTSGLPTLYSTHASAVIWEGTTPVMYLQTARQAIIYHTTSNYSPSFESNISPV